VKWKKRLSGWLADAALILYFVFALFPIAWMVILSLKPANQLFSTYFSFTPTLGSYRTVLGDSEGIPFVRFFVNSLVVSVGAVALSLVVGLPAAYASARWRFKGSENLMFTLLSFRFAPELTVIIPLFVLYQKLGLFDTYVGMVWVLQLVTLPLIVWIMRSYFADLTPELEQAALLDGYTRKQAFFKVALPLVRPGVAAVSLLAFIFAWNNFVFALILGSSSVQPVTVGALAFVTASGIQYGVIAAALVLSVVPTLTLALYAQRYLVEGLSLGAVKG